MEKQLVYKSQKAKELKEKVEKATNVFADAQIQLRKVRSTLSEMDFGGKNSLTNSMSTIENRLKKQTEKGRKVEWGFEAAEELYAAADKNSAGKRAGAMQKIAAGTAVSIVLTAEGMALGPIMGMMQIQSITKAATGGKLTFQSKVSTQIGKAVKEVRQLFAEAVASQHDPSNYYYSCGKPTKKQPRPDNIIQYDPDEWPSDYLRPDLPTGCTAASFATAVSALLGKKITPLEYSEMNGSQWNPSMAYIKETGKKAFLEKYGVITNELTATTSELDAALERYQKNPLKYSAPVIYCGNVPHAVVVTGKLEDGRYTTIDSGIWYDVSDTERRGASTVTFTSAEQKLYSDERGLRGTLTKVTQMEMMEQETKESAAMKSLLKEAEDILKDLEDHVSW